MAQKYAKDQPAGFTNRIEKVAIVGVSRVENNPENPNSRTDFNGRQVGEWAVTLLGS